MKTQFPRVFVCISADATNSAAATVAIHVPRYSCPTKAKQIVQHHVRTTGPAAELAATLEALERLSLQEKDPKGTMVYFGQDYAVKLFQRKQTDWPLNQLWVTSEGSLLANAELMARCFNAGQRIGASWEALKDSGEDALVKMLKSKAKKEKKLATKKAKILPPSKEELDELYRTTGFVPLA